MLNEEPSRDNGLPQNVHAFQFEATPAYRICYQLINKALFDRTFYGSLENLKLHCSGA